MLQVITHSQNARTKNVDKESPEWERRNACIKMFRSVEAQQTARRSEDERDGCATAPEVFGRQDAQEDGAEPAAESQKDGERVEDAADGLEGKCWHDGVREEGEVSAEMKGTDRAGYFDDQDGDCGFEAIAAITGRGVRGRAEGGCCGWGREVIGQCKEGVADEGREGGEGAAEACRKANE